jgi:hypothetical protein
MSSVEVRSEDQPKGKSCPVCGGSGQCMVYPRPRRALHYSMDFVLDSWHLLILVSAECRLACLGLQEKKGQKMCWRVVENFVVEVG